MRLEHIAQHMACCYQPATLAGCPQAHDVAAQREAAGLVEGGPVGYAGAKLAEDEGAVAGECGDVVRVTPAAAFLEPLQQQTMCGRG